MKRIATAIALTAGACAAPTPPAPVVTTTVPTTTSTTTTTAAPTTVPHTHAPRARRRAASVAPSEGMPGQDVTLECIKRYESGGNYQAVSRSGKYRGAHQWDQRTWNGVAARHRPDLVGVDPAGASPADQDEMAGYLLAERGLAPWPTPARRCA